MFNRKPKEEKKQQKNNDLLQKAQLEQLKAEFSDISFSTKKPTGQDDQPWNQSQQPVRETPLLKTYKRIKQTFQDLNSRSFDMYSYFSTRLNLGKQIDQRPQLSKISLTVNTLEILTVGFAFFFPRKFVYKLLFTMMVLTVSNNFMSKYMLNYFVEQFALHNNRMEPIEQQARNLIQYKYRIHKLAQEELVQETNPQVIKLLEEVDKKNIEYIKFKKVQMLL